MACPDLESALTLWRQLLGAEFVLSERERSIPRIDGTHPSVSSHPPAVLLPITVLEIQEIVRVAAINHIPLYPVSTGKNWGYGDACAPSQDQVIVDLRRMKKIVAMDRDLGLVTVEPGVTQRDLERYLDENKLPFLTPVTGSSPDCSLIGNALERGFGFTPQVDHCANVMALEAVLPDGRLYTKAHQEQGCTDIARAYKWGIGPYLDGLFFQGNFGIITQATIALTRKPEQILFMACQVKDSQSISEIIPCLQEMKAVFGSSLPVIKIVSLLTPLAAEGEIPAFSSNLDYTDLMKTIETKRRTEDMVSWYIVAPIYGISTIHHQLKSYMRQRLKYYCKWPIYFFSEKSLRCADFLCNFLFGRIRKKLKRQIFATREGFNLAKGIPSEYGLRVAYARQGSMQPTENLDPARDGCGLLWYSPLVPFRQDDVKECLNFLEDFCHHHALLPFFTITTLSEYCLDITVALLFDKKNSEACDHVLECYQLLLAEGRKRGWLPYRLPVHKTTALSFDDSVFWETAKRIKKAIDPGSIIAPGRYVVK